MNIVLGLDDILFLAFMSFCALVCVGALVLWLVSVAMEAGRKLVRRISGSKSQ